MITLDVADLVVIAGQVLGTGPEAALAQLDIAAAQVALALVHSPDPTSPDPTLICRGCCGCCACRCCCLGCCGRRPPDARVAAASPVSRSW